MSFQLLTTALVLGAVVYPVETNEPLHNPHKGWVMIDHAISGEIDAGRSISMAEDGTAFEWFPHVAVLSTWAHVEPEPGQFDWSLMDKSIDFWSGLGKPIHLRFSTDEFNVIPGCPRWLFDMGVPVFRRQHLHFPDYTHPLYKKHLALLLEELARKYADDPRIETVNLQGYGDFGEWHSGTSYDSVEERVDALRGIIDIWRKAFAGRKLLNLSSTYEWRTIWNTGSAMLPHGTSIYEEFPPSYQDYRHRSAFDYALPFPDITISRHGCAGAVKQEYDARLIANYFQQYRTPMFMEFFGGVRQYTGPGILGFPTTREGDDHVENAVDELLTHHPTYATPLGWGAMGDAAVFYNAYRDLVLEGHKRMGYRFVLVRAAFPDSLAPGQSFVLHQSWENRALGRCRYQFPLAVYLLEDGKPIWSAVDEHFDQRNWIAGETYDIESHFDIPVDLPPSQYDLAVAMVDTEGHPTLALAIEGDHETRRYIIGSVTISSDATGAEPFTAIQRPDVIKEGSSWLLPEPFETDSAYLVSFAYIIESDHERDLDTDDPGYFRFVVDGVDHSRILEYRWFDKAGQPVARKTLLARTRDAGPYHAKWETIGGGTMHISDVQIECIEEDRIRTIPVTGNDTTQDGAVQIIEGARAAFRKDRSQVELPDDWSDFLQTLPEQVILEPETTYTVWFYWAAEPLLFQGDYAYLHLRDGEDNNLAAFRWTQRYTRNPALHAYSFRTGPRNDYRLVWGVKNGGDCKISNIHLVKR